MTIAADCMAEFNAHNLDTIGLIQQVTFWIKANELEKKRDLTSSIRCGLEHGMWRNPWGRQRQKHWRGDVTCTGWPLHQVSTATRSYIRLLVLNCKLVFAAKLTKPVFWCSGWPHRKARWMMIRNKSCLPMLDLTKSIRKLLTICRYLAYSFRNQPTSKVKSQRRTKRLSIPTRMCRMTSLAMSLLSSVSARYVSCRWW